MADRALLRRAGWIALAVAVLLCVAGIFQHGLWTPDEPREAEIGREMLASHYSAMPTLGGEPFLEKPPLYAWITAASFSVFGVSAGAARVPAALFSIGAIWIAYLMGRRTAGRLAGLCSAIVLATMWQFSETSHKAVLDTALTFFVAAGHLAFLWLNPTPVGAGFKPAPTPPSAGRRRDLAAYVAIGLLSGLAFLTKSWIGPALLCAPPILAAAAIRDWAYVKRVLPRAFVAAVVGVAVIGLPWVLALAHTPGGGWAAVKSSLVDEYVGRTVGGEANGKRGHENPPWYYAYTALVVVAPWVLAVPAMIKSGTLTHSGRGGRVLWCAAVFLTGVLLLSIPSGKRDLYLLPLMPAAAVAVGVWLSRVGTRRGGAWDAATCRGLTWLAWSVVTLVGLAIAYAARGGRLPAAAAGVVEKLDFHAFGMGCVVVGLTALAAAVWVKRVQRIQLPAPARALWAFVVLFALVHAAIRPLADPLKDLRPSAEEVARLVPADEPMLGLSLDETTVAVVPWFTGRTLANVDEASAALAKLDAGPARHLVVMKKDLTKQSLWKERPELKPRLVLVGSTGDGDRAIGVYEYTKP